MIRDCSLQNQFTTQRKILVKSDFNETVKLIISENADIDYCMLLRGSQCCIFSRSWIVKLGCQIATYMYIDNLGWQQCTYCFYCKILVSCSQRILRKSWSLTHLRLKARSVGVLKCCRHATCRRERHSLEVGSFPLVEVNPSAAAQLGSSCRANSSTALRPRLRSTEPWH